jgi:hypothetical protein
MIKVNDEYDFGCTMNIDAYSHHIIHGQIV